MTREQQAMEVTLKIIGSKKLDIHPVSDHEVYQLIQAHDDAIRRECAERGGISASGLMQNRWDKYVKYINPPPGVEVTVDYLQIEKTVYAAILATEPAREEA